MGRMKSQDLSVHSLEGKTPLDDVTGVLVDVRTREGLNTLEFVNVSRAHALYLTRRPSEKRAPFTYPWFLKLHREMFGNVWKWAGQLRKTNKNIGLDKTQIGEALKNLEKDHHFWMKSKINPGEIAARLHHRLVFIHPFENGNGRLRWSGLSRPFF